MRNAEVQELEAELTRLKSQNEVLKKAVLQEQRKRAEAENKLEDLQATKQASQASYGEAKGSSGWLKGLGFGGHDERNEMEKVREELTVLREELQLKIQENESLHMRLFEAGKERESSKEEMQAARRELLQAKTEAKQRVRDLQIRLRAWIQSSAELERELLKVENKCAEAQEAILKLQGRCMRSPGGSNAFNPSNLNPSETSSIPVQSSNYSSSSMSISSQQIIENCELECQSRKKKAIESTVPLLRQLVTTSNVHYTATRERLLMILNTKVESSVSASHATSISKLLEALQKHQDSLTKLHSSLASTRSRLRRSGFKVKKNMIEPHSAASQPPPPELDATNFAEALQEVGAGLRLVADCWALELEEEAEWMKRNYESIQPAFFSGTGQGPKAWNDRFSNSSRQVSRVFDKLLEPLTKILSAFENKDTGAMDCTIRLQAAHNHLAHFDLEWEREQDLLANLGEMVQALVDWSLSLEAKIEGEKVCGRTVGKIINERMAKSGSEICDVVTRLHASLSPVFETPYRKEQTVQKREKDLEDDRFQNQWGQTIVALEKHCAALEVLVPSINRAFDSPQRSDILMRSNGSSAEAQSGLDSRHAQAIEPLERPREKREKNLIEPKGFLAESMELWAAAEVEPGSSSINDFDDWIQSSQSLSAAAVAGSEEEAKATGSQTPQNPEAGKGDELMFFGADGDLLFDDPEPLNPLNPAHPQPMSPSGLLSNPSEGLEALDGLRTLGFTSLVASRVGDLGAVHFEDFDLAQSAQGTSARRLNFDVEKVDACVGTERTAEASPELTTNDLLLGLGPPAADSTGTRSRTVQGSYKIQLIRSGLGLEGLSVDKGREGALKRFYAAKVRQLQGKLAEAEERGSALIKENARLLRGHGIQA